MDAEGLKALAAGLAIGLGALGPGFASVFWAARPWKAMGRNPEVIGDIRTNMILGIVSPRPSRSTPWSLHSSSCSSDFGAAVSDTGGSLRSSHLPLAHPTRDGLSGIFVRLINPCRGFSSEIEGGPWKALVLISDSWFRNWSTSPC